MRSKIQFKFSLRLIFILTALAAIFVYWFLPIPIEITCDSRDYRQYASSFSMNERIDIQGRNKHGSFETIIEDVQLLSAKLTDNPRIGRLRIRFRSSLSIKRKLRKFEILQISK